LDVPRQKPRRRRWPWVIAGLAVVITVMGVSRARPAGPTVERQSVLIGRASRAALAVEAQGFGELQPEHMRWVSALTAGRVEQIHVRPGESVEPGTVLLVLGNPDVQLEWLDAERQLNVSEASLAAVASSLEGNVMAQNITVAQARATLQEAQRGAAVAERLADEGLGSAMDRDRAAERREEASVRYDEERNRLGVLQKSAREQVALQRRQVERLRAIAAFHRDRVASMQVKAGAPGVVQQLALEVGQWVNPGALLAKVAEPGALKAVLRVPELQARGLAIGQSAVVDTRQGKVTGRVFRVDPSSRNGTVAVEVSLPRELPKGARPDLSVEGVVTIEDVGEVLQIGRPAAGDENARTSLFKLLPGGREAVRVEVVLGRASATAVEVVSGLEEGDEVVLSDVSRWEGVDRLRLR
jgi:HlyD family secretion protein